VLSLMMNQPLMISSLIRHADKNHGDTEIVSRTVEGPIHRFTYHAAHIRARRLARVLARLGVQLGDRVGTLAWNGYRHFELYYAVSGMGAVIHTINPRLFPDQITYIVNHAEDRYCFFDLTFAALVERLAPACKIVEGWVAMTDRAHMPNLSIPNLLCYEDLLAAENDDFDWPEFDENTAAALCYTSGTTGNPKGAWRPNGVNVANVLQVISIFELGQSDVHLMCGPGYHSAVAFFSTLHQLLGATVVVQPKFAADEALDLIERHRVSTTFMAPTLLQRLVDAQLERPRDVSSLRAVILGAAPCPYELKVRAEAVFGNVLWEFYGATETGINTVLRPDDQLRKPGSCGMAVPGQEIRLVGPDGAEVAEGEPGEFMVRNTWLAEYYNRPEATGKSLHDGFFSVGDVAYRDAEGYYYICDRRIDMIISGGVNIYPAEVEAVLHAHAAVMDAAVIGVPDEKWGESVKAVVQLRAGATATEEELIAFCAERLAGYKKPRSIDFVDELPRDAAGKLLKRTIREPYWASTGRRI
jgi:acyl-CoA synthetase (AMP-forming)/AMP-acid ligase II